MFHNFSSSKSPLAAKRRRVNRACDFCREHRVRCEAATPCPQCVANHVSCSRQTQSNPQRQSTNNRERQSSPLDVNSDQEETISILEQPLESRFDGLQDAISTAQLTPRSLSSPFSGQRVDPMLGFIARINTFCSGVTQLATSPENDPPPEHTSPFLSSSLQDAGPMECNLTELQISRLLLIFWTRLWPQVPIVRREDLRHLGHSSQDLSLPLRDVIIAYCMQYVYYSGLSSRILGLHFHQFQQSTQGSMIGLPYFQRCLQAVTLYSNFSQPSVLTLQCYCFMILYLLDADQHSAAYNMIGLALRLAQSLESSADTSSGQDSQNFRRAWWTLNLLDFRCSRHLGKPVNIRLRDLMCPPRAGESEDLLGSDNALYHTESIRLTAAALAIFEKTECYPIGLGVNNGTAGIEARAHTLSHALHHLRQWKSDLQHVKPLRHIKLSVEDTPADPNEELEIQDDYLRQPPMEILLTTLLELQYHDVIITLHRVFIQFPSHPLVPKSSPRGDEHSATALNHALAMIRLTHRRMTTHDAIHGISEIYQYIWNAVLTLAGFMLAYPYCYRCPRARQYMRLALEIFDSAGVRNTSTVRAASLTRYLCAKVDTLVQTLNIDQPWVPSGGSDPVQNSRSEAHATGSMPSLSEATTPQVESQPPSPACFNLSGDSLWSWVDFMNVSAWPSYCDEVSEAFTGPTKLPEL